MLKIHYPTLLADDAQFAARAHALAEKSFELTSFLVGVLGAESVTAKFSGNVTYHDSCSSLRELKVRDAPRRLLASVDGLALTEMEETEVCCGFGGAFSVKYPDISNVIGEAKAQNAIKSGAGCLLAGDLGCLLHIAGKLTRDGSEIECRHVAEVLAGMTNTPAIGQASKAE
jgi:L-lactate dehydrogenase complex protein LldE